MISALNYLHGKDIVHRDVKVSLEFDITKKKDIFGKEHLLLNLFTKELSQFALLRREMWCPLYKLMTVGRVGNAPPLFYLKTLFKWVWLLHFSLLGREYHHWSEIQHQADWFWQCSVHGTRKALQHILWHLGVLLSRSLTGKQVIRTGGTPEISGRVKFSITRNWFAKICILWT